MRTIRIRRLLSRSLVMVVGLLLFCLAPSGCRSDPFPSTVRPVDSAERVLTASALMDGFSFSGPLSETELTPPPIPAPAHSFSGRLELVGEKKDGFIKVLFGELESDYASLPEFNFELIQAGNYLIPVQRGLIIADHPTWNLILEPGLVWQEAADGDFSRASLPFTLIPKGGNSTFNGTLTFIFNDSQISKVWYQVTQETSSFAKANLWGLVDAVYHPTPPDAASQATSTAFTQEMTTRMPQKSLDDLAADYPGLDRSAFGSGVTPSDLTWVGLVVNGVNYLGGCRTRFGVYPYCDAMRAASFSTAKSAFVSIALMRLAQKYDASIRDFLIRAYVPEVATARGDWQSVTFNHTLDMATGNFDSPDFMADDNSQKMGLFFGAQPYSRRISAALDSPHATAPGTRWVYRTSDTFILTRAMNNYLQSREGQSADIFQFVVDEVYRPLSLGPGAFSTLRTADNVWHGQAEGGYGLWWIPDDIAKISQLLNQDAGAVQGTQILHPSDLAAAMQQDPSDRGVRIDNQRMYNNAFWATHYTQSSGFACEFWVIQMLGVSGNVVALFPNGINYYYFSDNQEFAWEAALRESDKIISLCP